jgi:hypothetical protein
VIKVDQAETLGRYNKIHNLAKKRLRWIQPC